jgi:hypothetical protein
MKEYGGAHLWVIVCVHRKGAEFRRVNIACKLRFVKIEG